jgi:hypothetical protein
MRYWLLVLVLLAPVNAALADEADPNLEFFYPLVTGRPVIERELELKVAHVKGREGRETSVTGAIELPLLPRWQIELEVPIVFSPLTQTRSFDYAILGGVVREF